MSVSLSHCYVAVHDPDAALASYRDALGLELRRDVSSEGFRWVTLSPPGQPDLEVVLVEPHAGRAESDGSTTCDGLRAPEAGRDRADRPVDRDRSARMARALKGTWLTWLSSGVPSRQITQALLASAFTGCVQAATTADAAG